MIRVYVRRSTNYRAPVFNSFARPDPVLVVVPHAATDDISPKCVKSCRDIIDKLVCNRRHVAENRVSQCLQDDLRN